MSVQVEKLEKNMAKLTVEVSAEDFEKAVNTVYNRNKKSINIPGFRKGKAPRVMIEKMYGAGVFFEDAANLLINTEYPKAAQESELDIVSRPTIDIVQIEKGKSFIFTAEVAVKPEVTLGEYKGIHIEKKPVEVTEQDVETEINKQLNNHATLLVKEDVASLNDTVIIDFKGYIDDIPFDGGEAKGYELKLGSNAFIPGFEDQLVGIKADEEREITVTFPTNYVENLAGKEAKFVVKCHEVKQTSLPTLDEEFVKELELENIETVDQYKEKVKADLLAKKQKDSDNARLNEIIEKIIDNATVEIAPSLLEDEAKAQIDNMKKQVESNGLKFEDYLKINNIDNEKLLADKKIEAEHNIKGMLVIEEVCRKENIVVDSKALNDKYEELAKMYNMKVEDVRKALEPNQNEVLKNLRNEMFTKFVLANNE